MKPNYNEYGEEILDQTPVAMPLKFKIPVPLSEKIRQMVREEVSQAAEENGLETFEEADDFEIEDEVSLPGTPYEEDFDPDQKFIADREAAIKHGVAQDLPEDKIMKGKAEVEKINAAKKSGSGRPKPAPEPAHKEGGAQDNGEGEEPQ